jgi:anti-sigma regulatory factor (Ser/Thr protein kinase)
MLIRGRGPCAPERGSMHSRAPRALALRTTSATYPGKAEHISAVRADLCALLADCPRADDVILCVSELAANAALHSDSRLPGGTFTVHTTISPGHHVRIDVEDNGGPRTPAVSEPGRHHGLDIVRALASSWGIEGDQAHRMVWVAFDWHAS